MRVADDAGFGGLVGGKDLVGQLDADDSRVVKHHFVRVFRLLVEGHAHPEAEFGVIFKQRVGPCRSASLAVAGIGRGGQVAAVNGGTAGGIGDQGAIAEQLREQLDVRGLAAAGAGTWEFEQRLEQLHVFDVVMGERLAVEFGKLLEELPVAIFTAADGRLGPQIDGLGLTVGFALDRADLDAQTAAGAVFGRNLQSITRILTVFPSRRHGLESRRRVSEQLRSDYLARRTECGQITTHLPHWMQRSCSQQGISCVRLRFSHLEVPAG